ncbi:MAG: class I SAM-dependent methyltransferase [Sedimentisphaerales bacterium]|nr:class I SAM-dependent methyltransferase [Sedimentisphaerales bacterium]
MVSGQKTANKLSGRRMLKESAIPHFQRWSQHYDRTIINTLLFEPCYRQVMTQLRQWKRRGANSVRLLDIGCGTGTMAGWCMTFGNEVGEVIGLDMSEGMIEKAREKAIGLDIADRAHFIVGDSEHLPFPDGSFDVVTCLNSFHHYPHQQRAVREMRRVLAPGGKAIIIDGARDEPWGYFIFEVCVARAEPDVHHCTRERFQRLLSRAGFERVEQRRFGVIPPALMNIGYVPET